MKKKSNIDRLIERVEESIALETKFQKDLNDYLFEKGNFCHIISGEDYKKSLIRQAFHRLTGFQISVIEALLDYEHNTMAVYKPALENGEWEKLIAEVGDEDIEAFEKKKRNRA